LSRAEAWETAEIRGPQVAYILTPENCGRMLKRAERPLIVVGGAALEVKSEGVDIPEFAVRLARVIGATVAASPGVFKAFQGYGDVNVVCMGGEELVSRLKDEGWVGFDGGGGYSTVVFIGGIYYFQSMMLSTLKHFSPGGLKTVSIDRFYHPNAEFSLDNMDLDKWREGLEGMLAVMEVKK